MKLRLKALLLALGLTVSSLSVGVYAEEETDASTEQVTEASEEDASASDADEEKTDLSEEAAAAEDETAGANEEDSSEDETAEADDEDSAEAETEAAEEETETEESMTAEEYYMQLIDNYLVQVGAWTDDQVDSYMESEDEVTALIAYNWNTVKSELGDYVEVTEITGTEYTSDGYGGTITALAHYEGVGTGGTVTVTLDYEYTYSSTYGQYLMSLTGLSWDVEYTMGVMLQKAAMNTLMGICIVFCMLAFLSLLISKIHFIPDMIEARKKAKEEEAAPVPKPAAPKAEEPAAELAAEEEVINPEDDLELVAVITAAIAAFRESETTVNTGDAYVVRSIKKVNSRRR
ncbi:MAG: OadG family protein [Lachnospiraceae bacterium]|nr:OadG family protein [Lachnospiraceae bacterium]